MLDQLSFLISPMAILVISFIIFLVLRMPLAFAISIASVLFFLADGTSSFIIPVQKMVVASQNPALLAVPFFVLAGNLMNAAGITQRLIVFCSTITAHLAGGLGHVTVLLSAIMGGVSGSAVADVGMQSKILGPSMLKANYSKGFAAASIGLSGLITATIPPSIGLILYGYVGGVSIGRLFLAGIVPGILMTIFLMYTVSIIAKKRGYTASQKKASPPKQILSTFIQCFWAILFPILLIVTIRFGIFTPSEAGSFAVFYALFIGLFIYKELNWNKVVEVLKQTVIDNAVIMLIISFSSIFGFIIVDNQVPQTLSQGILGISTEKYFLLISILFFLAVVGMFMEATVNVLLLTPIFLPIVQSVGVDPVHFGILMMTIVTLGGMTPPVGVAMFTACSILGCPTKDYIKESVPFLIAIFILLALLTAFPSLVLFLPDAVYG
ncbi:TRAP transporter large permease [Marinomonas primoryensis]|uniref:TRAP transporter large permease protein n=1 Tax=Marinomonas primoryensis TaxID=178399 RepID=A0A859CSY9_9GAMM|nr:TRAP transporter large permease [Marinomonas primoryensis]QKK79333.1 TRAP-type C4-dicarboxylate transport system large permease protein DctM [Marinomonas primoryensis]